MGLKFSYTYPTSLKKVIHGVMEEWKSRIMGESNNHFLTAIIPVFQHSTIPIFQFISILIRQGNRKEAIGNLDNRVKIILKKPI